ncbi:MAG: bifunctional 5,10-methylenetetrahydrofolate dehydrogenase/5,10-methenyltetrahydrofolate cyclohydrolase [Ruminococcus sp.]|nr:bifunctional 5,10-methylenetetrahydrofolate dehydrogenase/5,10-methenyltetrahydrofolate cyclohydrolase [Ruminococcus sp.]
MMKKIDGKLISDEIKENLKKEIIESGLNPGLAIVLVGHNPASEIYVRNKIIACEKVGIRGMVFRFDDISTEQEIMDCILELNSNPEINGIIVQSPVEGFDEEKIVSLIEPEKDVDGFGISNLGGLASNKENILSATPYGIIKLLEHENVEIKGKRVVIVGRSNIVGRPLALALLNRDATVTIAHSKTKDLKSVTNEADILIVAIGSPCFITGEYIKEGAVVIDVGTNQVEVATEEGLKKKTIGDVDFESASKKASLITPVPGGVGPMTIAMLLNNTVLCTKKQNNRKERDINGQENQKRVRERK